MPTFDGFASASILINYLKRAFPNINLQWRLHEGKQHGVIPDTVPNDAKLVIIPDAGSNQYKEHKALKERGIDVIVLDHHLCDKESKDAIVVNNQLSPEYPNKNFSGCGIVYKLCQGLDEILGLNYADYFLDLVAVGNIADSIDLRELETRYYVMKGLQQINNPLLKELFKKQEYSTKGIINITNVAFYISPLINAAVRSGSLAEKMDMMESLLESKEYIYNKKKAESEHIAVATARVLGNVRARQNRKRDKGMELIEQRIQEKNLNENKILVVNVTDILEESLGGLCANQLASKYRKPVLLLRVKHHDTLGGSGRGYEKSIIRSFKDILLETGKFNFVEGHDNAFGVSVSAQNLMEAVDILNEKYKDVNIGDKIYDVDFAIPASKLNINVIKSINELKDIWGNTVSEPLLVIKDLNINVNEIDNGSKENVIKFTYRDIDFIKFRSSKEEFEALQQGENITLDIVGKCSQNEWNGNVKQQLIIEDYEVVKVGKKQYVF